MAYNYSNSALATTLNGDITDTATSLVVVSAAGYPDVPFKIKIDTEIIVVNTKVGVTFSGLERGHEGSPNVAHSNTDEVIHVVTAEDVGGFGQGSWLAALFARPETVHADDDEFDDESIDVAWTEVTVTGTTIWTESRGVLSVKTYSQTASDVNPILKPMSATFPVTIETALRVSVRDTNYLMTGLIFTDGVSSTSNCIIAMPYWHTSGVIMSFRSGTLTSISSDYGGLNMSDAWMPFPFLYQRLIWTSANTFKYLWSMDGVTWEDHYGAKAKTMTPTHYGVYVSTWGGSVQVASAFEYFRVTEADLS